MTSEPMPWEEQCAQSTEAPPGWLKLNRGMGSRYINATHVNSMTVQRHPKDGCYHVFVGLDLPRLPGEWGSAFLETAHETEGQAFAELREVANQDPRLRRLR